MNIFYTRYALLCVIVMRFESVLAACSSNLKCLHYGVVNMNTCSCECFPSYSGTYCELSNCSQQPSSCGTQFTADMCGVDLIKTYCPKMCNSMICSCGIDSCLNGGTFSNCKCACPSNFYGRVCESDSKCGSVLTCLNNGVFNNNTCKCDCFQNYNGVTCEKLICTNDPFECSTFDKSFCSLSLINSYCPYLCGSCIAPTTLTTTTTTPPTTTACAVTQDAPSCQFVNSTYCNQQTILTLCPYLCGLCKKNSSILTTIAPTTACNILNCQNGGIFDASACKCSCPSGFHGNLCENFNCSNSASDPVECSAIDCSYVGAKGACPQKCFCNNFVTTTVCMVLECQNSAVFDGSLCKCNCPSGFHGTYCENFNCSTSASDPVECALLDCSDAVEGFCPKKCICDSSCTILTCQNNGVFDGDACVCVCSSGFSDSTCNTFDCTAGYQDPSECNGIDCSIPGVSSVCPQTCFCKSSG